MTTPRLARPSPRRQRGLSLIELMISMAIGLFLLAGLVGIFVNSSQTSAELQKSSAQIENGRYAMQTLVEDLSLAGFYGYYAPSAATASPDPCSTSITDLTDGMKQPVFGVKGADALWSGHACLPDANRLAGTGVLVVRRADTNMTTGNNFVVGETYMQANANPDDPANPKVAVATATNGTTTSTGTYPLRLKDNSTVAPVRKMRTHIYFIAPCSQPLECTGASSDDGIPTLNRIEVTAAAAGGYPVVPIAEGIENLQFEYGIDADGDGAPETPFVALPPSAAAWSNVVAVQVWLLARNIEKTQGYTDSKTYNLGASTSVTPADNYKRHAYSSLVRIINTSQRRETP
jgi:type IV pilus assembly protein PilW